MLLGMHEGKPSVLVRVAGQLDPDIEPSGPVRWWNGDGVVYLGIGPEALALGSAARGALAFEALDKAFADHRRAETAGVELMVDLEGLRRAWPESLADGPARRVVAVTGLANARKIHVHIPEQGAVRLATSSRAEPADRVTVRMGPEVSGNGSVGARVPVLFDAGLRAYAVALEDAPRAAFGRRFQDWMGVHGGRLRGLIQATEAQVRWSVTRTQTGLRTTLEIPVRAGIDTPRLVDAAMATMRGTGFDVQGQRGTLTLPEALARAMGGGRLSVEVDTAGQVAVYRVVVE